MIKNYSLLLVCTCMISLFSISSAEDLFLGKEVRVWGGYTSVRMSYINDSFNNTKTAWSVLRLDADSKEIRDAYILGLDFLFFNATQNIKLGGRVAYLGSEKGKLDINTTALYNAVGLAGSVHAKIDTSIIPVMVGGSYSKRLNKELTVKAKGFGGIGFVYAKGSSNASGSIANKTVLQSFETYIEQNIPGIGDIPSIDKLSGIYEIYDVDEHRECLVVDLSLGLEYELSQRWALGVDVGYRYTPEVKIDQLKLDFSGFKVVGGVTYRI
ncbi:hypothetical protein [Candidatus Endomicrobiellum devescovinae]|uniref:hypothetical protein n=1 Tax=Candidatus Endomicrobiellum devescovinae TaxID=3242322 RepID=UPI00283A7FA5|nr:hypothetical protein [Endomicrobium sp.]